jgi:Flp pilus assembly protein TadG
MITRLRASGREGEGGQIIVIFALSLVAIIAMVGLVLDGGSAFAQRRAQQNAADLAALAAANDLIVNQGGADWVGTARRVTALNGYADGVDGVTVQVSCRNCPGQDVEDEYAGVQVTVDITGVHQNSFAGVVGMPTWDVGASATSKTGWVDTGVGPGPFIVSENAFSAGVPLGCKSSATACEFTHPVSDIPTAATDFTWTDFGYDMTCHETGNLDEDSLETGNVDAQDLKDYVDRESTFSLTLRAGCYIAQKNSGEMNVVVARLEELAPLTFPVPIVDDAGRFVGWASFVMEAASPAGRAGTITGYFESGFQNKRLDVSGAGFGSSTFGGSYEIKLID